MRRDVNSNVNCNEFRMKVSYQVTWKDGVVIEHDEKIHHNSHSYDWAGKSVPARQLKRKRRTIRISEGT